MITHMISHNVTVLCLLISVTSCQNEIYELLQIWQRIEIEINFIKI